MYFGNFVPNVPKIVLRRVSGNLKIIGCHYKILG